MALMLLLQLFQFMIETRFGVSVKAFGGVQFKSKKGFGCPQPRQSKFPRHLVPTPLFSALSKPWPYASFRLYGYRRVELSGKRCVLAFAIAAPGSRARGGKSKGRGEG